MRIAYVILTCEAYETTRRIWQRDTVFGGGEVPVEDIYYLGGVMREADRVFSWGAPDDYDSLPLKFVDFFVQTELGDKYDWFFLMDDDTYLYVDRLQRRVAFLEEEGAGAGAGAGGAGGDGVGIDPQQRVYAEGCFQTHLLRKWGVYLSGGAGTLLSVATYRGIQEQLRQFLKGIGGIAHYTPPTICADICLGLWIKGLAGYRMIHEDGYHTEMARIGQGGSEKELTFHHLKEQEDFWAHWRMGQEEKDRGKGKGKDKDNGAKLTI